MADCTVLPYCHMALGGQGVHAKVPDTVTRAKAKPAAKKRAQQRDAAEKRRDREESTTPKPKKKAKAEVSVVCD